MKKVVKEFKEFIAKGSVIDLAVGVIIGGAFAKIISSLVNDVLMPVIGLIVGNMNLAELKIVFREADKAKDIPGLSMNIGLFLQTVIDFLLIALMLFLLIRFLNAFKRKKEKQEEEKREEVKREEPVTSEEVRLLTEIRDLLKKD